MYSTIKQTRVISEKWFPVSSGFMLNVNKPSQQVNGLFLHICEVLLLPRLQQLITTWLNFIY